METLISNELYNRITDKDLLFVTAKDAGAACGEHDRRIYKCRVNRKAALGEIDIMDLSLSDIAPCIEELGVYYAKSDVGFGSMPVPYAKDEDMDFLFDDPGQALLVWEIFFGEEVSKCKTEEDFETYAEKTLGSSMNAYNVYMQARRFLEACTYDGSYNVCVEEEYRFITAMLLNQWCESMETADPDKDSYNFKTGTMGILDSDDLEHVMELLYEDPMAMPEPAVGYMVLMDSIFGCHPFYLCGRYDELKPIMDECLDTLLPDQRRTIVSCYGLEDGKRIPTKQFALENNVHLSAIQVRTAQALRKLRHPTRSRKLKHFITPQQQ